MYDTEVEVTSKQFKQNVEKLQASQASEYKALTKKLKIDQVIKTSQTLDSWLDKFNEKW